jgi:hypothetical protein
MHCWYKELGFAEKYLVQWATSLPISCLRFLFEVDVFANQTCMLALTTSAVLLGTLGAGLASMLNHVSSGCCVQHTELKQQHSKIDAPEKVELSLVLSGTIDSWRFCIFPWIYVRMCT